jgi:hypothetical protein
MARTHEGEVSHGHAEGDVAHPHDEVTTDARHRRGPVPEAHEAHEVYPARDYPYVVRGGFSVGAILTGVAVAVGAMLLLTALIGGIVAAAGAEGGTDGAEVTQLGWGAAIGLIIAQFFSYLWGGYTSGRMARGLGWLNGLMVPIVAIVLAVLIALVIRSMGADTGVNVPFGANQVPVGIDVEQLRNIGLVAGIGSLVAMFIGSVFGGMLGARWHDKLESRTGVDERHLRAA